MSDPAEKRVVKWCGVMEHHRGQLAQIEGKQFWENPYAIPEGANGQRSFVSWFAGWCYAKQQEDKQ